MASEIKLTQDRDGRYTLLVDERLVLRSTCKRTVEHYYTQFASDDYDGNYTIVPVQRRQYSSDRTSSSV